MKVSALQHPAPPPQRPPAAVAEPSRPFRSLLEEPSAGHGDGAKAFCEGGLLGETDSPDVASPDMAARPAASQQPPEAPEAFRPFEAAAEAQLPGTMGRLTLTVAPGAAIKARDVPEGAGRISHATGNAGGATMLAMARIKAAVGDRSPAPLRSRPPTPTPTPAKARASLLVTQGDGGGLQVIAAAPGLDREAANRLRKLMSDVAAQFGLDLAALQLNGLQIEKPVIGSTGGPHGR